MKRIQIHTLGPWEYRYYAGGCILVSKHPRPGSLSVRDTLKGVRVTTETIIRDDQSNVDQLSPDARLVAAAPELLNALRQMVDAATMPWAQSRNIAVGADGTPNDLGMAIDMARTTLAKATGKKKSSPRRAH